MGDLTTWEKRLDRGTYLEAVITILPISFSFSTVIGDVFYPDPKSIKVLGASEQESPRAILKKRR